MPKSLRARLPLLIVLLALLGACRGGEAPTPTPRPAVTATVVATPAASREPATPRPASGAVGGSSVPKGTVPVLLPPGTPEALPTVPVDPNALAMLNEQLGFELALPPNATVVMQMMGMTAIRFEGSSLAEVGDFITREMTNAGYETAGADRDLGLFNFQKEGKTFLISVIEYENEMTLTITEVEAEE